MILETKINLKNKTKEELIMLIEEGLVIINKQQSEIEKKEAIINLMAKQLVEAHGWFYSEFDNFTEKDWIECFTKKVAEINVGDIGGLNGRKFRKL